MDPYSIKRKHTPDTSFSVKRQGFHGASSAGREYVEPRVFEEPSLQYDNYGELRSANGTEFSKWTPDQIKAFLDQRGGDYDDCRTVEQLIQRAVEVEANTGPAPSPAAATTGDGADQEDFDPLDAFMSDIASDLKKLDDNNDNKKTSVAAAAGAGTQLQSFKQQAGGKGGSAKAIKKQDLSLDEEYDPLEYALSRKKAAQSVPAAANNKADDSDEEVYAAARAAEAAGAGLQYDSDDNPILDNRKKAVDELPPLDHSLIEYDNFAKDFYEEGPEMFAMDDSEVAAYRKQLEVRVSGFDPPRPVKEFNQCGFDNHLMAAIQKAGYERPTAIQAQALPAVLSGRDVLGIAKTGSGKTAAFVLPMLVHIMDQPELQAGQGPIGLIVAPTRELAEQIHKEARKFSRAYNLRVASAIGGMNKYEQTKELKAGAEVAVGTPGRIIDLIKAKACSMNRCTYLVLDEADRMFDLGFEPQIRSIIGQIRPDRQTLLFSATMPRKVQRLVTDALTNPITITVGVTGVANADVRQQVEVVSNDAAKMTWLTSRMPDFIDQGEVIVFASQRAKVEGLVNELTRLGVRAGAIHGDMDQFSRTEVLNKFRNEGLHVLVATDVAARGLDIKTIKTVINYDAAKDIDTHIHRVGRTGRAGDKEGFAITLLLPNEARFASQLVQSLALAGQHIPGNLHELAMKDSKFSKGSARRKGGKGQSRPVGGAGLGFAGAPSAANPNFPASSFTGLSRSTPGNATFKELPGFAKSHDQYEDEGGAAAKLTAREAEAVAAAAEARGALPPPPPLPAGGVGAAQTMSAVPMFGGPSDSAPVPPPPSLPSSTQSQPGSLSAQGSTPAAAGGLQPAGVIRGGRWSSQKPSAIPAQGLVKPQVTPPVPQQVQQQQAQMAAATTAAARQVLEDQHATGRDFVKAFHESKFRSSFVSSGATGGTVNTSATVIAPKIQSASKPLPPPPVPVTERPMYLSGAAGGFDHRPARRGGFGLQQQQQSQQPQGALYQGRGGSGWSRGSDGLGHNASYNSAPPPSVYGMAGGQASNPAAAAAAAQAAIAAAQAIAARLAAQAPPGSG